MRSGKLVPVPPGLAAELAPLAALCGADLGAVTKAAAALHPPRQQCMPANGPAVAAHLQQLGMPQAQLAALLERCPALFSWPVEQRGGVLFGQLMALGLSAAEAGRCFQQQPAAATRISYEPAIAVLSELKAAGGKDGRQALAALLRRDPAAVRLLQWGGAALQQQI